MSLNQPHLVDIPREVFDKLEEYYTLDKLRKAAAVDRRITLREILEKVFVLIPRFKSKDELLEEEFAKFVRSLAFRPLASGHRLVVPIGADVLRPGGQCPQDL